MIKPKGILINIYTLNTGQDTKIPPTELLRQTTTTLGTTQAHYRFLSWWLNLLIVEDTRYPKNMLQKTSTLNSKIITRQLNLDHETQDFKTQNSKMTISIEIANLATEARTKQHNKKTSTTSQKINIVMFTTHFSAKQNIYR